MNSNTKFGTLYIVATPIGNMADITLRALEILKSVDLIACEDTRHTGMLLAHFEIKKPLISYFQHSQLSKVETIIAELESGKDIALVTDAGTPGISDPGQALIEEIRNSSLKSKVKSQNECHSCEGRNLKIPGQARDDNAGAIQIIPIPGVSAVATIASVAGNIEKEFYFAGFLPKKKGRQTKFNQLKLLDCPIVIYESANRLERTLYDINAYFGDDTEVFIGREMTKMFEEYWGGTVAEVLTDLKSHQMKGEIALIVKR